MTRGHAIFAACAVVFTVLLGAVGVAGIAAKSGTASAQPTQQSPGPQGSDTTQVPAPTASVPPATTEERKAKVSLEDCQKRIGVTNNSDDDKKLQEAGITPTECLKLTVELCQGVGSDDAKVVQESSDKLKQLGVDPPDTKCVAILAGVTTTTSNGGGSTPSTSPSDTTAPSTTTAVPSGTQPQGTAAPTTMATTPPSTAPPHQPDTVDLAIFVQKIAQRRGLVQGVGVTCETKCVVLNGIQGNTPEDMFSDLLLKGVGSPAFLDDAARTIMASQDKPYEDPRPVGDAAKAGWDLFIVLDFVRGSMVERGVLPAGTRLYNTVVQNGTVVQFDYVTSTPRLYVKFWKDNAYIMFFASCGNRGSLKPTPNVPQVPVPPNLPPESTIPPPTVTPPPTGGPTIPPPTVTTPTTKPQGKIAEQQPISNPAVPAPVKGCGPSGCGGVTPRPPNPDINPGVPNPSTGCPQLCPGGSPPTTRATPPSSAPVPPTTAPPGPSPKPA
ncbi:hypothetical protein HYX70_01140 [Candidatus Saccharibacteria bacterium]|nr:hypothetical protein [Candidatus Saccharibacteria bacterium]